MRYLFIVLLSCCAVAACNEDKKTPPIEISRMGKILTDLQVAEVYSSMVDDSLHRVMPKNHDSLAVYYNDVLAHHKVTQQEFEKALDWYKSNPDLLDTAYKQMISQLTLLEGMQQKPPMPEN